MLKHRNGKMGILTHMSHFWLSKLSQLYSMLYIDCFRILQFVIAIAGSIAIMSGNLQDKLMGHSAATRSAASAIRSCNLRRHSKSQNDRFQTGNFHDPSYAHIYIYAQHIIPILYICIYTYGPYHFTIQLLLQLQIYIKTLNHHIYIYIMKYCVYIHKCKQHVMSRIQTSTALERSGLRQRQVGVWKDQPLAGHRGSVASLMMINGD